MSARQRPRETPRARFLGAELRAAREARGISARTLAGWLGMGSHAPISLWETGKKIPTTEDVAAYLAAIGVTGEEREALLVMARDATQMDWLLSGPGMSVALSALMEFERTARTIFIWSPLVLPGLVQTGDYARVTIGDSPSAETKVKIRLGRRDILTRENPAHLTTVINERVLIDRIARPQVMVAQLAHLRNIGTWANVRVLIVPADAPYHAGYMGMFMTLTFDRARPIVHLEHHRSSAFIYEGIDVVEFISLGEQLQELALSPEDSTTLIDDIRKNWENQI